jgi:hypothetical protein
VYRSTRRSGLQVYSNRVPNTHSTRFLPSSCMVVRLPSRARLFDRIRLVRPTNYRSANPLRPRCSAESGRETEGRKGKSADNRPCPGGRQAQLSSAPGHDRTATSVYQSHSAAYPWRQLRTFHVQRLNVRGAPSLASRSVRPPIVDVRSWFWFAAKIAGGVVGANVLGVLLYFAARARGRS